METPTSCHYNAACAFFAAQVLFTFTTMVFCMVMIVEGRETGVFLPILSSVVSVWMPTPKVPVRAPKEGPPSRPPTPPSVNL